MPDDLKQPHIIIPAPRPEERQRSAGVSPATTVSLWTLSGFALVACNGELFVFNILGGGGGSSGYRLSHHSLQENTSAAQSTDPNGYLLGQGRISGGKQYVVLTAEARDENNDPTANPLTASDFRIDPDTGAFWYTGGVQTRPDFEREKSIYIEIQEVGSPRPPEGYTIRLLNVNDNPPVLTDTGSQVTLNEGTFTVATNTGHVYTASDRDGGTPVLTVSDDRFEIHSDGSLRIKAGQSFDYETMSDRSIDLVITAADSGVGIAEGTAPAAVTETVTITISNANDHAPEITMAGTQMTLNEGTFSSATSTGLTFTASDADGGTPSLSLTASSDSRFELVGGDLRIKAGQSFDYTNTADRSIDVVIMATDDGTGSGTAPAPVTVTVTITITEMPSLPPPPPPRSVDINHESNADGTSGINDRLVEDSTARTPEASITPTGADEVPAFAQEEYNFSDTTDPALSDMTTANFDIV